MILIDDRTVSILSLSLLPYKRLDLFFSFFVLLHIEKLLLVVVVRRDGI